MKRFPIVLRALIFSTFCLPLIAGPSFGQHRNSGLHPSRNYWPSAGPASVYRQRLSMNRTLASVGDTIYLLDPHGRVLWSWTTDGPPLTDLPIIDSQGTIYVVAADLIWVAIDSKTGQQKWNASANSKAGFTQIRRYRDDMYFVVTSMESYENGPGRRMIWDGLDLCRRDTILWTTDIPPGAEIKVSGNKVFAVYKQNRRVVRRPIVIPRHFGKPIAKVSDG
jgi:hypothetical protein